MGEFKGHKVTLFLSRELERALIQLQADMDLGRSFAGLLPWVIGMHAMGYLDDELFEKYRKRYSAPLTKKSVENWRERGDLKTLERRFTIALRNWQDLSDKAREWYLKKAKEYEGKIPNAEMVLALGSKEPVELMSHG